MNRRLTSVPFVLGMVWALTGCRPDFTQEMAAVESMVPVLDGLDGRLAELDTAAALEVSERLAFQCERILPALEADPLDSVPQWIPRTCAIPEQIVETLGRRRLLVKELGNTRQQLNSLLLDMRERRANKDSVSAFIDVEFQYVEHLSELLEELEARIPQFVKAESEVRSSMDSLMTLTTAKFVE